RSASDRPHLSLLGGAFRVLGRNLGDHLLPASRCRAALSGGACCPLVRDWGCRTVLLVALATKRAQEFVEQRDRRALVDGGAGTEGILPAGLERGLEVVPHAVRGVSVEAAHAWYLVAQA